MSKNFKIKNDSQFREATANFNKKLTIYFYRIGNNSAFVGNKSI